MQQLRTRLEALWDLDLVAQEVVLDATGWLRSAQGEAVLREMASLEATEDEQVEALANIFSTAATAHRHDAGFLIGDPARFARFKLSVLRRGQLSHGAAQHGTEVRGQAAFDELGRGGHLRT